MSIFPNSKRGEVAFEIDGKIEVSIDYGGEGSK